MRFATILLLLTLTKVHALSVADNWHQWRGPENNGVSRTAKPPVEWSEQKNVGWKIAIGGHGTSSPIVWGDKVFVTTAIITGKVDPSLPKPEDQPERVFGIKHPNTSYQLIVLCVDRKTGNELWRKVAKTLVPHEGHHKDASFASASPFCDGERIYCWFGSGGLFAYSLDGEKLWERNLGRAKVGASLGEGSSPVVHDGKIVLVRDHAGQSTIEVLNATNGKTIWKKDRDEKNAWATPAVATHDGVTQVITTASKKVRSYNLNDGEIIWKAEGLTGNCTPCPIVDGKVVYCMSGYEGYSLLAIPITGKGDVTDSIIWNATRGTPYVPSPILYDGLLYFTQSNQNILHLPRCRRRQPGDRARAPAKTQRDLLLAGRRCGPDLCDRPQGECARHGARDRDESPRDQPVGRQLPRLASTRWQTDFPARDAFSLLPRRRRNWRWKDGCCSAQ